MPVWHASIAYRPDPRKAPQLVESWTAKRRAKAATALRELLGGVGTGPDHWSDTGLALHLRRRLSDAELARIDPAWLALPAIDPG